MKNEIIKRMKTLALQIIALVNALPRDRAHDVIGRQLLRSGTSIGANYRAACRAKSPADFIAKMGIVEEEADETIYWIELLVDLHSVDVNKAKGLMQESEELLAITVASIKTARKRKNEQ